MLLWIKNNHTGWHRLRIERTRYVSRDAEKVTSWDLLNSRLDANPCRLAKSAWVWVWAWLLWWVGLTTLPWTRADVAEGRIGGGSGSGCCWCFSFGDFAGGLMAGVGGLLDTRLIWLRRALSMDGAVCWLGVEARGSGDHDMRGVVGVLAPTDDLLLLFVAVVVVVVVSLSIARIYKHIYNHTRSLYTYI